MGPTVASAGTLAFAVFCAQQFTSTMAGKIFTMFYIFIGIGIILGFVNAVAERSVEQGGMVRMFLDRRAKGADPDGEGDRVETEDADGR